MIEFLKKRWADVLIGIFILIMLIPQTRMPIQIFIQRMIALAPSEITENKQKTLENYNLIVEDSNQQKINLNQSKGDVILINFWATWCAPCVAEMPHFSNIYSDYKDKVDFYFITQDDWNLVQHFEAKRNYNIPYYKLIQPHNSLHYTSLPTTYLISKSGKIIMEKTGVADWNSDNFRKTLDKLISE